MERRTFLRAAALGAGAVAFGGSLWRGAASAAPAQPGPSPYGALLAPDANGVRLPAGFGSRVVARSSRLVGRSGYFWHPAPDGGACFGDGSGWIYVSNSEIPLVGGVSAIRFAADGSIGDAYRTLSGTSQNRAGGATPWGTWLSCEELPYGRVFETDPQGRAQARARPAMGRFTHEAAACDPVRRLVYLTEDGGDMQICMITPTGVVTPFLQVTGHDGSEITGRPSRRTAAGCTSPRSGAAQARRSGASPSR